MKKRRRNSYSSKKSGYSDVYGDASYPWRAKRRKSYTERMHRRKVILITLSCLGVVAVAVAAYVITTAFLDISELPPKESTTGKTPGIVGTTKPPEEPTQEKPTAEIKLKAIIANAAVLNGGSALDELIESAKAAGHNSVVIDFKNAEGLLSYSSKTESDYLEHASASVYENALDSLSKIRQSGLKVIARVYCFKDETAARAVRNSAVHYGTGSMLWLDAKAESGGKPWLNPYSEQATDYLISLIGEIAGFDSVDFIILEAVQYPATNNQNSRFDGESGEGALSRNEQLLSFVTKAKSVAGNKKIIVAMESAAAMSENSKLYDGNLWNCSADYFAINFGVKGIGEDFVSPEGKRVLPVLTDPEGLEEYLLLTQ